MSWQAIGEKLVTPIAIAALLGGGSTVIANKMEIARLDVRVERIEQLGEKIDQLNDQLQHTREDLARSDGARRGSD